MESGLARIERRYTDLPATSGDWQFRLVLDYGEHDLTAPTPDTQTGWPSSRRLRPRREGDAR